MTAADRAKPCVLVLDDEKNIRASIEIALASEGYQVLSAHDAASAMRTLNERVVDLLLLDIRLGDIDGLTFFRKLLSDGIDVPVECAPCAGEGRFLQSTGSQPTRGAA